MILCDTGPLVALIDEDDQNHSRGVATLASLPEVLVTTWACLAETMYLAGRAGGHPAQERVWEFVAKGLVNLHQPQTGEWERMRELMHQYAKTPMDLADASLVSAAERLGLSRIFTFDGHFYAYRIGGTDSFDVIPG